MKEISILMVCLGNICRSPMADGLLQKKVSEFKLPVAVDSAGTGDWHVGNPPDERMRATAKHYGVPIDHLRARQFKAADFDHFDQIYVMDLSNQQNVLRLARNKSDEERVKLLLNELHPGSDMEVPDPYFGGEKGFHEVFKLLDDATQKVVEKLKQQVNE